MQFPARLAWLLAFVFGVGTALGGGSGFNVIVVVNQNSTNSVQLGNDYCEKRGVPPQNLFRITNWSGGAISWGRNEFEAQLRDPLLAMISNRGLTNQAELVLLSMDIPYRVADGENHNSTTGVLFYGFKTNTAPPEPGLPVTCSLPDVSSNSYALSELPFREGRPNTATTNSFLAVMLTGTNFEAAEMVLNRGVASDRSYPTQPVYLAKTSDWARNVRYTEFDNAVFETRLRGDYSLVRVETDATGFTNLAGLQTGLFRFNLATNGFVPGAIGDTLTSFAGGLFENQGQSTLLEFLTAGAAGSYGTVTEPCNYLEKFPDPLVYFYQNRGFSLAEAYYQSVRNPYQGLFVGEPLSAPFERPGGGDWNSLTNGTVLSGQVALDVAFLSAETNLPLGQVDLFVDGNYIRTVTNLPPSAGNVVSVRVSGFPVDYTVPADATSSVVVSGLAAALNAQTNATHVRAQAVGDRVVLRTLEVTNAGTNVSLEATASAGTSPQLTTFITPARSTFLDSAAVGYLGVVMSNTPAVGDWIQLEFTKTNGEHLVVSVTNTSSGTTMATLVQKLMEQVNTNSALQSGDGVFAADFVAFSGNAAAFFAVYARSPGWPAAQIQAALTSSTNLLVIPSGTNRLEDNLLDLQARNHLYVSSGAILLPVKFTLDTAQLADGFHELGTVAYQGDSVRTQTRLSRTVRIQNTELVASLSRTVAGTNVTLDTPLQFLVSANANLARTELFSTGGLLATATNQQGVVFDVPNEFLGPGLHPFYALVTDTVGRQYRTETQWIRLLPPFQLSASEGPGVLSWRAIPGQGYEILTTTDLATGFTPVASVVASNSVMRVTIPGTNGAAQFYRVRLSF